MAALTEIESVLVLIILSVLFCFIAFATFIARSIFAVASTLSESKSAFPCECSTESKDDEYTIKVKNYRPLTAPFIDDQLDSDFVDLEAGLNWKPTNECCSLKSTMVSKSNGRSKDEPNTERCSTPINPPPVPLPWAPRADRRHPTDLKLKPRGGCSLKGHQKLTTGRNGQKVSPTKSPHVTFAKCKF
ncbi:hypothetical protein M3Y94_00472900 [Aphelenchoides besseyi]|nr:hypothetical protein M3Y94_00472900 [Aphelenchoides besseyi]KAI6219956.1 hypothetical protein M3Y95_01082400 [Aphelenchoides besseyi]